MIREKVLLYFFFVLHLFDIVDSQACGSVLSGEGVIVSPGHPNEYPSFINCAWKIQADDYDLVRVLFGDFDIEPDQTCSFDYLEITAMETSKKFCGDKLSDVGYNGRLRLRGPVLLRLSSDDSVNHRGFSLNFEVEPGTPPPTTPPPTTLPPTTLSPALTCDDAPCQNGGECTMIDEIDFYCFCEDGFEGTRCEIDIDECASNPCQNGGTCTDGPNAWSCECVEGFIGESCGLDSNECLADPCKNGATCIDKVNAFFCSCAVGWTGWDCDTEIDECSPNPCLNNGFCEDHLGYHSCICHPKYTGQNCSIELDEEADPSAEMVYNPQTSTSPPERETPNGQPVTNERSRKEPSQITRQNDGNPDSRQDPLSPVDGIMNAAGDEPSPNRSPAQLTNVAEDENITDDVAESKLQKDKGDESTFPLAIVIGGVVGFLTISSTIIASLFYYYKTSVRTVKVRPITT